MRRMLPLFALAAAFALAPQPAGAWGHQGHAAIDQAALAALPDDGPAFLRAYGPYVGASATLPDAWRTNQQPFSKMEEDPNHGWFRERFAFMRKIPRSRYAFVLAVYREHLRLMRSDPQAARHMNVRGTGLLAYAVMEQYGHLLVAMQQLRKAQAAGKADEARFMEQNCAEAVVRLGHYLGDGAQPLHDTINSDGWVAPANPKNFTSDHTIHARFESRFVKAMGLNAEDVRAHMAPLGHQQGDLFDALLGYLDQAGDRMELVYQLDKKGALADPNNAEVRALIHERTGAGASMLRDMIVRAWQESRRAQAEDHGDSLGPGNPDYDPETGSAPAPSAP